MKELEVHPLARIVPRMAPDEFRALKADIKAHGLEEPITLYENMILDGIHRARACRELGLPVKSRTWTARNGSTPLQFVLSMNDHRRHLSPGQKAALAVELAEEMRRRHPAPRDGTAGGTGGDVRAIARELGQHHDVQAQTVLEVVAPVVGAAWPTARRVATLKTETPRLYQQVRDGLMSVAEASRERKKQSNPRRTPAEVDAECLRIALAAAKKMAEAFEGLAMRGVKPDDHSLLLLLGWVATAGDAWKQILGRRELSETAARKAIRA